MGYRVTVKDVAFATSLRVARIAALVALLAGCTAPTQYQGPIVVDAAGFSGRFRQLCARRLVSGELEQACGIDQPIE